MEEKQIHFGTSDDERREHRSFRLLCASSIVLVLALLLQASYVLYNPKFTDDVPFFDVSLWLVGAGIALFFVSMATAPSDNPDRTFTIYGKWWSKNL